MFREGELGSEKISELDQAILVHTVDLLNNQYHTVDELVKLWMLFGPCLEKVPRPEVRKPWMAGLGLTKKPS